MARMKNIARILALVLVLCAVLVPLSSCKEKSVKGFCTVVIATEPEQSYKVNLDKVDPANRGLISVLDYLAKNEKDFKYAEQAGFLSEVQTLKNDAAAGVYIYLYTSVEKDQDVSEYKAEKEYNGTKLISSGVGADQMHMEDGAIIYIGTISWS